jgi:hypothetical protein
VNHSSPDGDENEKKDLERQSIMAASDDLELADSDDEEAFEVSTFSKQASHQRQQIASNTS